MSIRLVICVDIETDDVMEAYRQVRQAMFTSCLDWESSDEWFDSDGELGDPEVLQAARMKAFGERHHK